VKEIIIKVLIISIVFLFNQKLFADSTDFKIMKDPSTFIKEVSKSFQTIFSIESDFVQKKHLSFFADDVSSKGKFYFKKDNLLRWEYTSPIKYIMVMNRDMFFIKDENKIKEFDVKSNKMISEINEIMIGCIKGSILKNDERFIISYYESGSKYLIKLKPLSEKMKEFLQRIELYFSKTDFALMELWMIENSGDYSKISFLNRKINLDISDEKFNIK